MIDLPDLVIDLIMNFTNVKDQIQLSQTCSYFYHLLNEKNKDSYEERIYLSKLWVESLPISVENCQFYLFNDYSFWGIRVNVRYRFYHSTKLFKLIATIKHTKMKDNRVISWEYTDAFDRFDINNLILLIQSDQFVVMSSYKAIIVKIPSFQSNFFCGDFEKFYYSHSYSNSIKIGTAVDGSIFRLSSTPILIEKFKNFSKIETFFIDCSSSGRGTLFPCKNDRNFVLLSFCVQNDTTETIFVDVEKSQSIVQVTPKDFFSDLFKYQFFRHKDDFYLTAEFEGVVTIVHMNHSISQEKWIWNVIGTSNPITDRFICCPVLNKCYPLFWDIHDSFGIRSIDSH